jgi:holin-like protein
MALLFFALLLRAPIAKEMDATADTLLKHLSLLFVPAGVGVVQHLSLLGHEGLRLILVVVLATVITLAVTALTFECLARVMQVDEAPAEHDGTREPGSREA